MTKTSQDNNLNYVHFLKHFYEYHTEKLNYLQRRNMLGLRYCWQRDKQAYL